MSRYFCADFEIFLVVRRTSVEEVRCLFDSTFDDRALRIVFSCLPVFLSRRPFDILVSLTKSKRVFLEQG
jgi:hypothetical protein